MKVILLQQLSGAKSYDAKEEIEVSDHEALRFIGKGIAKAKSPKAHNDLVVRLEKAQKEEEDKQSQILAIQKEDELKAEAYSLLEDLIKVVDTIGTNDEAFKETFIEQLHIKLTEDKKDPIKE